MLASRALPGGLDHDSTVEREARREAAADVAAAVATEPLNISHISLSASGRPSLPRRRESRAMLAAGRAPVNRPQVARARSPGGLSALEDRPSRPRRFQGRHCARERSVPCASRRARPADYTVSLGPHKSRARPFTAVLRPARRNRLDRFHRVTCQAARYDRAQHGRRSASRREAAGTQSAPQALRPTVKGAKPGRRIEGRRAITAARARPHLEYWRTRWRVTARSDDVAVPSDPLSQGSADSDPSPWHYLIFLN